MVALQGYLHLFPKCLYSSSIYTYILSWSSIYLLYVYKMGESLIYIGEDPLQHVATI